MLVRGFENGKRVAKRVEYKPTLFIPSKKETKYKTLDGRFVDKINPGNIQDTREFLETYKDVDSFPIYGNNRFEYCYISDITNNEDVIWDQSKLVIAYIDIEVNSDNGFPEPKDANEEVTAITILIDGKFTTFGCGIYKPHKPDINYIKCEDETELLRKFLQFWSLNYPDIVTGWNIRFFDIPYLINRMTKILDDGEVNTISPWKKTKVLETTFMNKEQQSYQIFGVAILDYIELYRKYSPVAMQESYQLNHISFVELGERKMDYSDFDSLHDLYKRDFQKYIEYNIRDTELVHKIETQGTKSSKLLELALTLAYDNKINYEDVFQQVRMWDAIIFNHLRKKNIVIPMIKQGIKDTEYTGAFVKAPVPGLYNWVVSFDLDSLYPHIIMQYNLSPETIIDSSKHNTFMKEKRSLVNVDSLLNKELDLSALKNMKVTVTPNKQFFRTDVRGFLGEIMDSMYKSRKQYKKMALDSKKKLQTVDGDPNQKKFLELEIARYNNLQMAKKVSLNSAYGAAGNQYFRFYDIRIAEAVTLGGQLSYKWIEKKINEFLNKMIGTTGVDYIIAGDTDSMYLNLEALVKKFIKDTSDKQKVIGILNKFCEEKIQPFITDSYKELAEYTNAYEQKMNMKRESLCDRAIWTAKKRYILNVYDEEGVAYKEPKIKIVGLEAIKSSTPSICRTKIKEAIKIILDKDEDSVIKFIEEFRESFKSLPVEDISFPRSVNGVTKNTDESNIFIKGTPIHCKGSIIYNHILKQKKLTKKYQPIRDGDKIKFCYLKEPNPYKNNSIAFLHVLPKELEIHEYINYDEQFIKSFLDPMTTILKCIGWESERKFTLESFFHYN